MGNEQLVLEHDRSLQKHSIPPVESFIGEVLGLDTAEITDELEYRSILNWDSLGHVNLILALEKLLGIVIDDEMRTQLTSVPSIRRFIQQHSSGVQASEAELPHPADVHETARTDKIFRGLAGVTFDRTRTTLIDGKAGRLQYRGYSIHDLVTFSCFEETAYLLVYGTLPTQPQLETFKHQLAASRSLPPELYRIIESIRDAQPVEVLRTAVSALACFDEHRQDGTTDAMNMRIIRLIAQIPTIIAAHHAIRNRTPITIPHSTLPHAANFLYMLQGELPTEQAARIVDKVFILHADHGSNASAFTARVVAGTKSDLYAAVTAAVSAFAGSLHGGAIESVMTMVLEIGHPDRAEEYIRRLQEQKQPVMGFGHRVYQTEDPRARHLKQAAYQLSLELQKPVYYEILEAVVKAMKPYMAKGMDVNVDFYASVIYYLLGLPKDLFIPVFAAGRMPGWIAQIQEQYDNNILIRPLLQYVGEEDRPYIAIGQR
ncbi:citrate (Si)-synthase [Paenibacillus sambharensis]|uniref:citrate synthase (unknown stereospecificity) n=1 Tax=Paenibacillus sambharensis TaxID=1803190 RepID=A0A2W1L9C4_9BACL|nr:citrate/2-methylcitrate synthase [Paenibacillus sambharensis]PZD96798.1 citrate (Si)-synthase [Paenibacillus sambharensis]